MSHDIHQHKILILDFGSQTTQLIARRVREIGVYSEIRHHDISAEEIRQFAPKGIILSGGPNSVTESATPRITEAAFELGCPLLGICYGMQSLSAQFGGRVLSSSHREFGYAKVEVLTESPLFKGLTNDKAPHLEVWMSHGDRVEAMPKGFKAIARSDNAPYAAIADESRHYYGVQFHPEVTHTLLGKEMLANFVLDICGCDAQWKPGNIIDETVEMIKQKVGKDEVILGLSGGVDSSVTAALLHEAIGDQLTCVFIDNGLLRLHEAQQVMETFSHHMKLKVVHVKAEERFLTALAGVKDPEEKRKIIGHVFVDVFEEEAMKLRNAKWLAQGTIYPDVIESAGTQTGTAKVIKSHHNVGGLPQEMTLSLIEPLRELFKDEVRTIGTALGLSHQLLYRHPFPGPGLGVRVLGELKKSYLELLRQADAIFMDELEASGWYDKVSQAFTVFLPVKSVGVMGDARHYDYVVALRAVETVDFMTARWAHLPYDLLGHVSNRIINEVSGITRVTYDISGKPPATIEWE